MNTTLLNCAPTRLAARDDCDPSENNVKCNLLESLLYRQPGNKFLEGVETFMNKRLRP